MGTTVQVRRTSIADREANTETLVNPGEIGVNLTDGRMWVANTTDVFEVGANTKNCRVSNSFYIGNDSVNVTANSTEIVTGTIQVTTAAYVGDNVDLTTAGLFVGNSTVNLIANSITLKLANSTVNTSIKVPTSEQYGGSYYLHANGDWAEVAAGPGGEVIVEIQNSNPSTPANGQVYWNNDLGKMVVYYGDGNTEQWVEVSSSPRGLDGANGADGADGANGADGADGANGAPGANGVNLLPSKSMTVYTPVNGDSFTFTYTNTELTVAEIQSVVRGTSPSVTISIYSGTDRTGASNTVIISANVTTNVTTGNTWSSFGNATVVANSWIWGTITAVSGTTLEWHGTIRFTE